MTPWILLLAGAALAAPPVHHVLSVHLDPADHRLSVDDAFTVGGAVPQDPGGGYRFVLHAGLEPRIRSRGWRLEPGSAEAPDRATAAEEGESVPVRTWRLVPGRRAEAIVRLSMSGEIHHPVVTAETDYARGFAETPGLVDAAGVFLTGASRWVPTFGMERVTYDLAVHLPQGWDAVSQGHRSRTTGRRGSVVVRWTGAGPAEEVVLAAGPWTGTWTVAGDTEIGTLLVQDDPALAWRYLDATRRTLAMYEAILPPYPFPVFVTAENFWETGYGFPGFTLLGPKVLRFPWVLASSFPHEILHSWWGNGVLVAAEGGNWCEGLTAYMADHLLAEQRQEGALHRRNTLQRYADFVAREGRDFPLSEFTGRTSAASEAVGYGKALLLFHMARRSMGDEAFLAALNRFFETHRFRRASFADLAAAFDATDPGWRAFFETWTRRTGAPRLALGEVGIRPPERRADAAAWRLEVEVRQVQHEDPFPLTVPVAVTLEGSPVALEVPCTFEGRTCRVTVPCPNRPLRVDVDPAFDVVRLLDPFEVPPALSTVQGDTEAVFVLPSGVSEAEDRAWRDLA
ncbi:MAG: peptidase M28, partial [Deltaproteobacteria bacterium]|nr:peptidase M28 [Deltaproteobacteria bacterium]